MKNYSDGYNITTEGRETGKWILNEDSISFIRSNTLNGLFIGLGALGGAISAATHKEEQTVDVKYSDIRSVEFTRYRLNKKSILILLNNDAKIQMIVNHPDKWLTFLQGKIN